MKIIIYLFLCWSTVSFSAVNVSPGQSIKAADLNSIQAELTSLKSLLSGNVIEEEFLLYTGNIYLDGSSNYNLWSSASHQAWDAMDVYVSYDNGGNAKVHRIALGPTYSYGNTSGYTYTTLICSYEGHYRRLIVTTSGFDVHTGTGAGFYIRKVVGIKKKVIP